jgi:NADH-quinone oxidoreductase subunit C
MNELEKEIQEKFKVTNIKKHSPKRVYIEIDKERAHELARFLYEEKGFRFSTATGTDTRRGYEILYHFSFDKTGIIYSVRTVVPKDNPKIASLATFLPAANWIEREMWELIGIEFEGHPNLKRLLTAEDFPEGYCPLRRGE